MHPLGGIGVRDQLVIARTRFRPIIRSDASHRLPIGCESGTLTTSMFMIEVMKGDMFAHRVIRVISRIWKSPCVRTMRARLLVDSNVLVHQPTLGVYNETSTESSRKGRD